MKKLFQVGISILAVWLIPFSGSSQSSNWEPPKLIESMIGFGNSWQEPDYATFSDDKYAFVGVPGTYSVPLKATVFGFSVPTGSYITGVEVSIEKSCYYGNVLDYYVQLVVNDAPVGNNLAKSTTWPGTDQEILYGGSSNLWGITTLTPAVVNSDLFGVAISCIYNGMLDEVAQIDAIRMKVYYSSTAPQYGVSINSDGSSPDPCAILELKSTSQALLLPRMTPAQRDAILSPKAGLFLFTDDSQSSNKRPYYYNGTSWNAVGSGNGTVTEIATGTGLTGGPISGSGTIKMADMTAYTVKGRATGTAGAPADIAVSLNSVLGRFTGNIVSIGIGDASNQVAAGDHSHADMITGSGITGKVAVFNGTNSIDDYTNLHYNTSTSSLGIGTASPDYKLDVSGVIRSGDVGVAGAIRLNAGATGSAETVIKASGSTTAEYSLTLPPGPGSSGQFLSTDGAGVLSWKNAATTAWGLSGNDISSTNVFGTTGTGDTLKIITQNIERMRIRPGGSAGGGAVVIGTDSKIDTASLLVYGGKNSVNFWEYKSRVCGYFKGDGQGALQNEPTGSFDRALVATVPYLATNYNFRKAFTAAVVDEAANPDNYLVSGSMGTDDGNWADRLFIGVQGVVKTDYNFTTVSPTPVKPVKVYGAIITNTNTSLEATTKNSWGLYVDAIRSTFKGNVGIESNYPDSKLRIQGTSPTDLGFPIWGSVGETNETGVYIDNTSAVNPGGARVITGESATKWSTQLSGTQPAWITGWHSTLLNSSNSIFSAASLASVQYTGGSPGSTILYGSAGYIGTAALGSLSITRSIAVSGQNARTSDGNAFGLYVTGPRHYLDMKVGIGTTAPQHDLSVVPASTYTSQIHVSNATYPNAGGYISSGGPNQIVISGGMSRNSSNQWIAKDENAAEIGFWEGKINFYTNANLDITPGIGNPFEPTRRMVIDTKGDVGVGLENPTSRIDVEGTTGYNQLRLRNSFTPTNTADTRGNVGDIAWDNNYIYVKTGAGWKRSGLSTW